MIYEALKSWLLDVLRAPTRPPEPPVGSPGSVETFRASPQFLRMRLILHFVSITPAIALEILFVATEQALSVDRAATYVSITILVLTVAVTVVRYFLLRLDYDMRHYVVTDRSLRIRQGALTIHESTYTFANVQNLVIRQGPVERMFGVANLHVETAGGGSGNNQQDQNASLHHRGILAGIVNATEVRNRISALLKAYRDSGLGDRDDTVASEPTTEPPTHKTLREVVAELRALKEALDR